MRYATRLEALQGTDPELLAVSPMRAALQTALAVLGPWITRPRPGRAAPLLGARRSISSLLRPYESGEVPEFLRLERPVASNVL